MSDHRFDRIDGLIRLCFRLARSAPTGRIALARLAATLDPAWLPGPEGDQIARELEAARAAACEPIDAPVVERLLREAWGAPVSEELDALDPDPVAITPTSQVHRGVLDGELVAVKVLRPGIAASVRQDLVLLERLLSPLAAAFPAVEAGALLREFRERILDELDLEHEAVSQRRFHRALRNHPLLFAPAPVMSLCHESVLVSQWVQGVPLWNAPHPDEAAARLLLFVLGAGRSGMINADPNPDDALVMADGRLAILDFGAVREVDPARVALATSALEASIREDAEALGDALEGLGWLPASHARTALKLSKAVLGELAGPDRTRLDSDALLAAAERLSAHPKELIELLLAGSLPAEDLWPARAVAQLFGTIARLGATGSWRELALAALRDGWSAGTA